MPLDSTAGVRDHSFFLSSACLSLPFSFSFYVWLHVSIQVYVHLVFRLVGISVFLFFFLSRVLLFFVFLPSDRLSLGSPHKCFLFSFFFYFSFLSSVFLSSSYSFFSVLPQVLLDGLPSSGLLGEASLVKSLSLSSLLPQSTERRRETGEGDETTEHKGLMILKRRETGEIKKEEAKRNRRRSSIEKKSSLSGQEGQKTKMKDEEAEEENTTAVFSSSSSFSSSLSFLTRFLSGGLKRGSSKQMNKSPDNHTNSYDHHIIRNKKASIERHSPRPVGDNKEVPRGVHTPQGDRPIASQSMKTSDLLPPPSHPSFSHDSFAPSSHQHHHRHESFQVKTERQTSSPGALDEEKMLSERERNPEKKETEEEDDGSHHLHRESVDVLDLTENKRTSPSLSRDRVSPSFSSFSRSSSCQEDRRQAAPSLSRNSILLPSAAFAGKRTRRKRK